MYFCQLRQRAKVVRIKGFTMIELVITLVIVGILATISFAFYGSASERMRGGEARTNLELIFSAERIVLVQTGGYLVCDDAGANDCNDVLNLDLRGNNWLYSVDNVAAGPPPTFMAHALRNGGATAYNGRQVTLSQAEVWGGDWPLRWW